MLKAQRQSSRQQKALTKSSPAPIFGWNSRDPLAAMGESDAVVFDNWFARTGYVITRRGCIDWATGFPGQVNSMLVYNGATSSQLFGCAVPGIYNATSQGTIGAAVVGGLIGDKFKYVNFSTAGGKFLLAVNGADLAQSYDGTTWSNPAITGLGALTTADFDHISIWKSRVFLTQKNSMSVWYLGINSIAGAASQIDFGSLFKMGGRIVATANWTIDGGYGMDDHLVIITSKGQIAVYNGTDPSSAANFVLIGVYDLGSPVGNKPYVKYGGELIIMTLDGFQPLSGYLTSTRTNNKLAISDKISGAVTQATTDYQNNFGWEVVLFPKENMLLFNIPVKQSKESQQYVMNTITGAWSRFLGWNANSFEVKDDDLYFAANGKICKAWQGFSDSELPINTDVKTSFSYFNAMGQIKQWKMARLVLNGNLKPNLNMGLNVDFEDKNVSNTASFSGANNLWDQAIWDSANWSGVIIYKDWQSVSGYGYCAALRIKTSSTTLDLQWSATDYVYEPGGIIG